MSVEARFRCLDGWRAISILLVLGAHLLPLGPKSFQGNEVAGQMGMAIFFTLSGFLITKQLHAKHDLFSFFVRRAFRILPLALAFTVVVCAVSDANVSQWRAHLLFVENYEHAQRFRATDHLWSICVELHFYLAIGLVMALTRFRGFKLLVPLWLGFMIHRAWVAPAGTIETDLRVDEILAGSCLALVVTGELGDVSRHISALLRRLPVALPLTLLIAASHPQTSWLNAFRGLFASAMVGASLVQHDDGRSSVLTTALLRYIAEVSYAIYIIHPVTALGWLGTGPPLVKYSKRLISFALTFGFAHVSTFYVEAWFIRTGKRISSRQTRA